ncbi:MAG: FGGY-family carbohydrate kinase, partial [Mollicutes bacterium]|nr:FGGY-family carbohydrate kinase [Mollicutes bacterium]
LIGVINNKYTNSLEVFDQGFTNELNSKEEIRFLKNIVGMFIINEIEKEQKERINILTIVEMAKKGTNYKEIFDPTEHKFLAPASMEQTIKEDFIARKIEPPKNLEELFYCVYNSLAHAYKKAVEDIEEITHKKYDTIKVFGGGSKNKFLNQLTEDITKKRVIEGPSEATAIGNIYSLLD